MELWPSRRSLRGHERLQSRPRIHVLDVVARFGDLKCICSPNGSYSYSLECVRPAESGEPRWTEGEEDGSRIAKWHTARDAKGGIPSADVIAGTSPNRNWNWLRRDQMISREAAAILRASSKMSTIRRRK